jgi:hypothetical protein
VPYFLRLVVDDLISSHDILFYFEGDEGSRPATTTMEARVEDDDDDDSEVDFGTFNQDAADDVPALLEAIILDDAPEDNDEGINSMPAIRSTIDNEELADDTSLGSIDNFLAEEDGLLGGDGDGHIIDDDLEDLDEHAAKWEAYVARKAADIGKTINVEH